MRAYQKFINDVARFLSPNGEAGRELAADVLSDLFMPDRSGQSRIALFDGQQSLRNWLRFLIRCRAINRALLKWKSFESLDRVADLPDDASVCKIEAAIRRNRCQAKVEDSFREAAESLTAAERLVVLLRYDEGLRVLQIAMMLDVHPSGITRRLKSIDLKLKKRIISALSVKHRLGPAAIKKCVAEILENPAYSLRAYLKDFQRGAPMPVSKCGYLESLLQCVTAERQAAPAGIRDMTH